MLILASSSPRRRELLQSLGLKFRVQVKPVAEDFPPGMEPGAAVELLSQRKARAVAAETEEGLVIGADTVVVYNNKILGKPASERQAKEMLTVLQGTSHYVYSGVAVVDARSGKTAVTHQCTKVSFKPMTEEEIDNYVSTGEPMDKAGAYAAQGIAAVFIAGIEGCYFNVVGLPIERLAYLLKKFDYDVLNEVIR
ncbi:septum formation protein [Desulfohalotomaculum tongense]|uniref:Maf family protein n=1 Tax=Desulforadius tongensis TaxID=1216062 RepID=UPI003B75CF27|nr:septum formation protein [Desulforadius tongensis]